MMMVVVLLTITFTFPITRFKKKIIALSVGEGGDMTQVLPGRMEMGAIFLESNSAIHVRSF